jgi:hypothetical protein
LWLLNLSWKNPSYISRFYEIEVYYYQYEHKNIAESETAAAHPRAASCGASKAPPHKNGTR